jgi:hypothetical protein
MPRKKLKENAMTVSVSADGKNFKESSVLTAMMNDEKSNDLQISPEGKKLVIKKAKLVDGLTVDIDYHEQIILISGVKRKDIGGTISREGDNAAHDDLKKAFAQLVPHLALISEIVDHNPRGIEAMSEKLWEDFSVTGFAVGKADDGVTLIGQKKLSTGKILNITTPFTKWEDEYTYSDALAEAIEACKHEVIEYLNGKMAPPAQQEIEFEEQETAESN